MSVPIFTSLLSARFSHCYFQSGLNKSLDYSFFIGLTDNRGHLDVWETFQIRISLGQMCTIFIYNKQSWFHGDYTQK